MASARRKRGTLLGLGLLAAAFAGALALLDCGGPGIAWALRLSDEGNQPLARALARPLAKLSPDCPAAQAALVVVEYRAGNFAAAEAPARRAAELRPENAEYLNTLANTLMFLRKYEEAAGVFARAAEVLGPERAMPGIRNFYGLANYKAGRLEEARGALEEVTRAHPEFFWGWANLSLTYQRLGRPEDADGALARARAAEPENPGGLYIDGALRALRGDPRAGFERLQGAVRAGYDAWYFIETDADIASVRALPEFPAWFARARGGRVW